MRTMPSVTDTTVPWLRMSALAQALDAALDQFRNFCGIELHDSFLLSLGSIELWPGGSGGQGRFHLFQTGLDRGVQHLVAHHHANAADQLGRQLHLETLSLRPKRFSSTADRSASSASAIGKALCTTASDEPPCALASARNCAAIFGQRRQTAVVDHGAQEVLRRVGQRGLARRLIRSKTCWSVTLGLAANCSSCVVAGRAASGPASSAPPGRPAPT
jgi:hypothetical protein